MRNDRPVRDFGFVRTLEEICQSIGEEMRSASRILGEKGRDPRLSEKNQNPPSDEIGRFLPY